MGAPEPITYTEPRQKGEAVSYCVTYLEMTTRPRIVHPPMPANRPATLIRATDPPLWYFFTLYDAVGRYHEWQDRHDMPEAETAKFIGDDAVDLYTLTRDGWPHGFFMLDYREAGTCDLAYFGLVPEAVGQGLGGWLLKTAILTGWDREGVARMTVNTCTLDHPRALTQYQRHGFTPIRQDIRSRTLTRDWDPGRF